MADDTALIEALKQVVDPELMINVVDLGLIYEIEQKDSKVIVEIMDSGSSGPPHLAPTNRVAAAIVARTRAKFLIAPADLRSASLAARRR